MASNHPSNVKAYRAEADLSAKQYRFVIPSTDDKHIAISGAGGQSLGILMNEPAAAEEAAEIALIGGGAKIKLAATVALNGQIKSDANGDGVPADTDKDWCGAIAVEAGVSGDIVSVMVAAFEIGV